MGKLTEVTTEIAEKALGYLSGVENFVVENAPAFITEIYTWNYTRSGILLLLGIFLLSFGFKYASKLLKDYSKASKLRKEDELKDLERYNDAVAKYKEKKAAKPDKYHSKPSKWEYRNNRYDSDYYEGSMDSRFIKGIAGGLGLFLGSMMTLSHGMRIIKMTVAPKLWLVEYFREFLNG